MSRSVFLEKKGPETQNSTGTVVVLGGPTGSGKSALALAMAMEFGGLIINADSIQMYRELKVLSNRPSVEDLASAPHRLYGVLSASDNFSAADWRRLVLSEISSAHQQGMLPIVAGGTGFYLKALLYGLSSIPDIPSEVRLQMRRRLEREGSASLHEELSRYDEMTAKHLQPTDGQRVVRALEVLEATGTSITEFRERYKKAPPPGLEFLVIVLQPPRHSLYESCDKRLIDMVRTGVVAEISKLRNLEIDPHRPIMKAIGIVEFGKFLDGEISIEQAIKDTQQSTRHYAKRQTTWFRTQIITDYVIKKKYSERINGDIFSFIRQNLLTISE